MLVSLMRNEENDGRREITEGPLFLLSLSFSLSLSAVSMVLSRSAKIIEVTTRARNTISVSERRNKSELSE